MVSLDALQQVGALPDPVASDTEPARQIEEAEAAALVRRELARLPTGQRVAAELFYLRDLSLAETAAQLGIAPGAVKTRLHNARQTLRRRLDLQPPQ